MTTNQKIDEWALHAYVDGELADDQRSEVEALLLADPEAARTVDTWRRQRQALREAFDPILEEPLPASLLATASGAGSWRAWPYAAMAAGLALFLLGGLSGWYMASGPKPDGFEVIAGNALSAYRVYTAEVRHPVEVEGRERDHLQAWLSKRVGTAFSIPDLSGEGYNLLGGRLLVAGDRPAALLMYEDGNRKRLTVYLTQTDTDRETALRVEQDGNLIACYWLDGKLGFAVAGEMEREPMMKLANIIYEQIES